MYEYDPKSPKKEEKAIVLGLLAIAAILFGVGAIPGIPYPALYQFAAVFSLTGMVLVLSRCLLRRYTYAIAAREDAAPDAAPDLVITEFYGNGNRAAVVCRISLSDIEEVLLLTRENRKSVSSLLKKKRVYHYLAKLIAKNIYLLTVRDEDEIFYIRILADEKLISALSKS